MKATVTLLAKGLPNPFIARPGLGFGTDATTPNFNSKNIWKAFHKSLKAVLQGGLSTRVDQRPVLRASTATAKCVMTCATVVNANAPVLNGTAVTAAAHRSHQTVQFTTAIAGNTVTVNGILFTAVAGAATHGVANFSIDTSDTATAISFADQVNFYNASDPLVLGKSSTDTVTLFAKLDPVTAADAIATDAYTLAKVGSPITLGGSTFTGGVAAVNNEFDYIGNNNTTAKSFCDAVARSTTALVSSHFVCNNQSAKVTLVSVAVGDYINLSGEILTAGVTATDLSAALGARDLTQPPNVWCQASTDTNDAISLCNCINFHPRLGELYYADNASGVVIIHERSPGLGSESYVTSSASTMTVSMTDPLKGGGVFGSNPSVLIEATRSGIGGNAQTVAQVTTTMVITDTLTRLAGGTEVVSTF